MRIIQPRKLYLPALSILAVVILLLVFISFSTYRNLDSNRKNAMTFVHRQGVAMIRTLEAGARAGMLSPMWEENSISRLIVETGKNEDIAYIYLTDAQRRILHHSDRSRNGISSEWSPPISDTTSVASRFRQLPDGTPVYELAKRFAPFPPEMSPYCLYCEQVAMSSPSVAYLHRNSVLVMGLKMTAFEEARKADLRHAVVMAAILVALASGAIFFIFVIQNYYLVDTTLKQTQDYTRKVVDCMANGLVGIDSEGKILSYNLLALELLGLDEPEIKGMNLSRVIDFRASGVRETLTQRRSVIDREIFHRTLSGEVIPLALSITPISEEGGTGSGAVIILRDLREIRRLEEKVRRAEKLAAIGKLAATVAHEIRNPLSSIRGFAQFLGHILKDRPHDREYAGIMVKEIDRISRVVTDLLTFARPLEAELSATDADELISHTLRLVAADACSRGIRIQKNIRPETGRICIDTNQMIQVLLNLILNALQEVEEGERLEVGAAPGKSEKGTLFWVEDEGSGIPPEHQVSIFDPFFTTREKGTGLGLAIVRKIVENHQGEIRVQSPLPGRKRGCRFTVFIPTDTDCFSEGLPDEEEEKGDDAENPGRG